jgi:hypothetical protein
VWTGQLGALVLEYSSNQSCESCVSKNIQSNPCLVCGVDVEPTKDFKQMISYIIQLGICW